MQFKTLINANIHNLICHIMSWPSSFNKLLYHTYCCWRMKISTDWLPLVLFLIYLHSEPVQSLRPSSCFWLSLPSVILHHLITSCSFDVYAELGQILKWRRTHLSPTPRPVAKDKSWWKHHFSRTKKKLVLLTIVVSLDVLLQGSGQRRLMLLKSFVWALWLFSTGKSSLR